MRGKSHLNRGHFTNSKGFHKFESVERFHLVETRVSRHRRSRSGAVISLSRSRFSLTLSSLLSLLLSAVSLDFDLKLGLCVFRVFSYPTVDLVDLVLEIWLSCTHQNLVRREFSACVDGYFVNGGCDQEIALRDVKICEYCIFNLFVMWVMNLIHIF